MVTLDASTARTSQAFADFNRTLRQQDSGFHARLKTRCACFSHRELEIVVLIWHGLTDPQIGAVLGISFRTVDNARYHIRKKLELKREESLYQAIQAI
ncbi:MAG: helix-turn-helix transcriptional regulator [Bacteroidota bacterium]|nr:helix-turn-helix transcriptional regulator [Bacteroidota bacterium]MDP4232374.1 helix-turn-helix transcriptional regulator [Bacteroidota bacterium]MDP4241511.1 helix-turn-helix transcriptional regulator [Bacteroidota bacterium]MDP4288991.1 helix-turn-helix transcriptional regulator [Bacteroidota bacterium]